MRRMLFVLLAVFSALILVSGQSVRADDRISDTNYYAAYYDGHYGEITDGYWGRHGRYFWFKDRTGTWREDSGNHFQRDSAAGFTLVHGSGAPRSH